MFVASVLAAVVDCMGFVDAMALLLENSAFVVGAVSCS